MQIPNPRLGCVSVSSQCQPQKNVFKKIQKIVFPQIHKPPKTERKDNPKTQTKTPKPIPKFTQFSKAVPKPIPKSA